MNIQIERYEACAPANCPHVESRGVWCGGRRFWKHVAASLVGCLFLFTPADFNGADHNDPNSVNSIFSGIEVNPADLYDFFGWPSDDTVGGEKVVLALTFASVPQTRALDPDLLYRILVAPTPRFSPQTGGDASLATMLKYIRAVEKKYVSLKPAEIRVTPLSNEQARVQFINFAGGSFAQVVELNKVVTLAGPRNHSIKAFVGGRDDAFFNDLPGFFRSINYAPEFYNVRQDKEDLRELKIPKTLLELEGNKLFNFDPATPLEGPGEKPPLPSGPLTWNGNNYVKDAEGNFRFVYSGKDAQAGRNIDAIIVEVPLAFLTVKPAQDRVVNAWGESWVLKAASKIETIPDNRLPVRLPFWLEHPQVLPGLAVLLGVVLLFWGGRAILRHTAAANARPSVFKRWVWPGLGAGLGLLIAVVGLVAAVALTKVANQKPDLARTSSEFDEELRKYKLIDTDGQPFADAALNLREDDRQLGAFNFALGPDLVTRLAHLGWGFGPSISALGLQTSFDHDNSPVPVHKEYSNPLEPFPRARKVIFQPLNMPDDKWNKSGKPIPLRRPIEIFIPNVCAIDMDTTGTWPFGRRPEDQVATRFLSLFLDMNAEVGGKKYNIETLADQSLWNSAPIKPKTPPNPLKNDKEFLTQFPYLAEPW